MFKLNLETYIVDTQRIVNLFLSSYCMLIKNFLWLWDKDHSLGTVFHAMIHSDRQRIWTFNN